MWKKQRLQHSPQVKASLEANLRGDISPFSLSTNGVKIGVHNWSHGIEEKSNKYLSPENAVKVFMQKMTDYADVNLPKGVQDVVCVMVATSDIDTFIDTLNNVAVLLPEPTFKQACDYAKSSKTLADTKMIKTPQIAHPAFAKPADITPQSARELQSIMRNVVSGAMSATAGDVSAVMAQLAQRKAERQAQNQQKIMRLLHTQATLYAFKARGELAQIAGQMNKNVPNASHIFTAAVCFIGANLNAIAGMLNDITS
ncbi:hypothetical protein [Glaesserella parasuis]|uniref:hypothetical protein n=1 Tax=Glaesserella parasuis TaxID=738 RepID=UPI0021BDDC48|nr:hypothetical protein [Glaesserella parasuis]MCT8823052.1 hypothetical protein [Glaesserella parasuis]MCT8830309.1 hypothetical protein [Glaesserella parasuis]MCT8835255.1 hypothetical protein [Glaesserella parasuis]MDG6449858.1 hypothetical protein [Glaesserella parasuis]MDO9657123.1 hypothetical protein [Glaesserella parasuis]